MVCLTCLVLPFVLWIFPIFISPWLSLIWSRSDDIARDFASRVTCPLPRRVKKKISEPCLLDEEFSSDDSVDLPDVNDIELEDINDFEFDDISDFELEDIGD